ncbi:MAG TPA: serine protein kinase RIO [Candidatus Methanofastidiosa archaeon]|nr:serine protein kinase RIO [Candidatus Methanofastidiosa archaeon]
MYEHEEFNRKELKKGIKTERMRKDNEVFKVRDGVFDKATMLTLYDMIKSEKLESVEGIVSTGKEANVFWGYTPDGGEVAIKIHRITASTFKNLWEYLIQDPRFKDIRKNHRHVVFGWTRREYKNLSRLVDVVPIPRPLFVKSNVIVMDFLGSEGIALPKLKEVGPQDPEEDLGTILGFIKDMYKKGIVHADLSEYNILVGEDGMSIIDFSQGTVVQNANAKAFLYRDIENILRYFSKFIETPSADSIFEALVSESDE